MKISRLMHIFANRHKVTIVEEESSAGTVVTLKSGAASYSYTVSPLGLHFAGSNEPKGIRVKVPHLVMTESQMTRFISDIEAGVKA